MSYKFKNLIKIFIIFFVFTLFYFVLFLNIKNKNYSDNKDFELTYIYYLPEYGKNNLFKINKFNEVYLFTVMPDLYFDLFVQNFTKQFNKYNTKILIEDINSELSQEEILDLNKDLIYLRINSNDSKFYKGKTLSVIIKSDKENFKNFNDKLFNKIINFTNINYLKVLRKYIDDKNMFLQSYEKYLENITNSYIEYLENIQDDNYRSIQHILYKLRFNLNDQISEKILRELTKDKLFEFENEKLFSFNTEISRNDLILFLKDIKLYKNYELLAFDYTHLKTNIENLTLTYNKYLENIKQNKNINENIYNLISVEKYLKKDESFKLKDYQIVIVTFIFAILSTIILNDLLLNRKDYWKIIKNI